jgi:fimbrial chaperone protein
MIKRSSFLAAVASFAILTMAPASAGSIGVFPVTIDSANPTATLTLRNNSDQPSGVQVRIFKWTQKNGRDSLVPTTDAVVSPPQISMQPNGEYVVRVVRSSNAPATEGEDSYRVLVDEIPRLEGNGTQVAIALRQSIPVFFADNAVAAPELKWQVFSRKGRMVVRATNVVQKRARISGLAVKGGKTRSFGAGLNGYVLGGSVREWVGGAAPATGSNVTVVAKTEEGPVNVKATMQATP